MASDNVVEIRTGSIEHNNLCAALRRSYETDPYAHTQQVVPQQKAVASKIGCEEIGHDPDDWTQDRELLNAVRRRSR